MKSTSSYSLQQAIIVDDIAHTYNNPIN